MAGITFNSDASSTKGCSSNRRGATAKKWIHHEIIFVAAGQKNSLQQNERFLGWMLPEFFFPRFRCREVPDVFHLFTTICPLHCRVVKHVPALAVFGRPKHRFR